MAKRKVYFWEVLGVLAIIFVVVAILFPVFARARYHNGSHHSCLSNQKFLGLALLQYAQDYNGLMPNISDVPGSKNTWRAMIYNQFESRVPYRCPDDDAPNGPDGFPPSYAANYSGNYNGGPLDKGSGAFAGPGSHPLSLYKFPAPDKLILLCEVQHSAVPEFNIDDPVRFGPSKHILAPRHSDGSNYLLADGHCKWFRPLASAPFWYRDGHRPLSANADAVLRNAHG